MIIATDVQVICNTFYACNTNFIGHTTKAQALAADKDKWKCLPSCANANDDVDMEIQEGDGPSGLMENKVPDDEMVNQTIARSEEEFELFQRMDMERRSAEADLGAARKPRLIQETELPDFLIQDPEEIEQEEKEEEIREAQRQEEMGRGNRLLKEVTNQEQLIERDWLKAIGAEDEASSDEEDSEDVDSKDGDTSSGSSDEEYTPSRATTVAAPKKKVATREKLLMQGEEMSEYEKIRAANIKQKEEMLKTLQLKGDWQDLKESEGLVAASGRSQKQKQKRASHVLRTEAEHRSQGKKDEILTSSHDGLVLFSLCNLKMFHEFQIYEMHMILEISHAFHIHEI